MNSTQRSVRWIRNNWGLNRKSPLNRDLSARGWLYAEDMSGPFSHPGGDGFITSP